MLKEMKKAYGYIVRNGCYEDALTTSRSFIIFADGVIAANKWIEDYIKQQIEGDKREDDDGNVVNWWWKYYSMEKIPVSEFDKDCCNIVWLE